jgi:hypothetical protein
MMQRAAVAPSAAVLPQEESPEEAPNDLRPAENLLGGNAPDKPGQAQRDLLAMFLRTIMLLAGLFAVKNTKLAFLLGLSRRGL